MINRVVETIQNIGISDHTNKDEIRFISFTNILIVVNGFAIFVYIPYFINYLPDSKIYLTGVTCQFIFYFTALVLNYFQYYFAARLTLCLNALIFTAIESVMANYHCDIHFFLLIGVIFAFFVFPENQKKCSYLISILFASVFIIIEIRISYIGVQPFPPDYILSLKYVMRSALLFLIFFFAYYSYITIRGFQMELKEENLRMEKEIDLARRIQQQMIPAENPGDNFYSLYKPMYQVGGDFYDYIYFSDSKKIGIFLSDVSGHGVPAAFITTMIKTAIFQSDQVKENPADFLIYLNDILVHQSGGNFVTAFYGIFDPVELTLFFSNAGHNSPFLITPDSIKELDCSRGKPLAIFTNEYLGEINKTYRNTIIDLPVHSKLLLYTDGLVEARSGGNSDIFFNDSIYKLFETCRSVPCRDFINSIYKELVEFHGSEIFDDDICMICLDVV